MTNPQLARHRIPDEMALVLKMGKHAASLKTALSKLEKQGFVRRLLARDPTLWSNHAAHAEAIRNRLGWLTIAGKMEAHVKEIRGFAEEVKRSGTRHLVLLGMGGSSLCPDVLRQAIRRRPGYPDLLVLDSTDPEAVAAVEERIIPARTLFIVASKSGTTVESQMLFQYFFTKAGGERFIAITDPGTVLQEMARRHGFRRVFTNEPDIGGRYSALSFFGMVPAACIGIDIGRLLKRGRKILQATHPDRPIASCQAVVLGAALASLAEAGRDKVTFVASRRISSFGFWVEQLLAESTGKEGTGLVPVEGEELGPASVYGTDRVFIHLRLRGAPDDSAARRLGALARAGHPCVTIRLEDLYDLGAEFIRWEIATAVAGSLLGINPFDEPNVKESKENTTRALAEFRKTGSLPETTPDLIRGGIKAWQVGIPHTGKGVGPGRSLSGLLDRFCRSVRPGDYIALMAYVRMDEKTRALLSRIRLSLRKRCRAATTLGFGPRYLHSTGQLHKGGAGNGAFIQITSDKPCDLPIPGETFSFGILEAAQAAGDFQSLAGRGYRLVRLHLSVSWSKDLKRVMAAL